MKTPTKEEAQRILGGSVNRRQCEEAPRFPCPLCGNEVHLYYNGGELDEHTCCGIRWSQHSHGYYLEGEKA